MYFLFFLNSTPVLHRRNPDTTSFKQNSNCSRRPRSVRFRLSPHALLNEENRNDDRDGNENSRKMGDAAWMNLARDLVPDAPETDTSDSTPSTPQWEYPEGQLGPNNSEEDNAAWRKWQTAVDEANEQQLEARDPKAETDFWRTAARDITTSTSTEEQSSSKENSSTFVSAESKLQNDLVESSREEIWGMARGVSGEMSELQNQLRTELEEYNPTENTDQYRNMARELTNPPTDDIEQPSKTTGKVNFMKSSDDIGADPGSGWNPDVDWMRYDDVGRELLKKRQKEDLRAAEQNARELQQNAIEDINKMEALEQQEFTETGGIQDEAGNTIFPTYTDQSVSEDKLYQSSSGDLPGFIKNRYGRTGTYGSNWSKAEEEAAELKAKGVPLRDPKADSDAWRSVARELNLEVDGELDATLESEERAQSMKDFRTSTDSTISSPEIESDIESFSSSETNGSDSAEVFSDSDTAENSWSAWRTGNINWEAANKEVEQRDPKKEVDMWRSNARELTSGIASEDKKENDTVLEPKQATSETSVWEQYRDANAKWKSSLSDGEQSEKFEEGNPYRWMSTEPTTTDWGAAFDSKATSDKAAWENWDNVGGQNVREGARLWWETKLSSSSTRTNKTETPGNDLLSDDLLTNTMKNARNSQSSGPKREKRVRSDPSLQTWMSVARELSNDGAQTTELEGNNDSNEK